MHSYNNLQHLNPSLPFVRSHTILSLKKKICAFPWNYFGWRYSQLIDTTLDVKKTCSLFSKAIEKPKTFVFVLPHISIALVLIIRIMVARLTENNNNNNNNNLGFGVTGFCDHSNYGCLSSVSKLFPVYKKCLRLPSTSGAGIEHTSTKLLGEKATTAPHSTHG